MNVDIYTVSDRGDVVVDDIRILGIDVGCVGSTTDVRGCITGIGVVGANIIAYSTHIGVT